MCCFTGNVIGVNNTGIFARAVDGDQYLVYQMTYEAEAELAMVLPLPAPPNPSEDAVRFVDLSGYPDFFKHAQKGFDWIKYKPKEPDFEPTLSSSRDRLEVHAVGSYEASFVPRMADFSRLDPRFRLSEAVWAALPQYADWSFCVFKLKAGDVTVHPMAFRFPRRDPLRLYFPTVHVHDGSVRRTAWFNHFLFCQGKVPPAPWYVSRRLPDSWHKFLQDEDDKERRRILKPPTPYLEQVRLYEATVAASPPLAARDFMNVSNALGVLDADTPLHRHRLFGELPNRDHYV